MGTSKYRVWGQDELAALRRGISKHGAGNWEAIRKDPELADTLAGRSGEQIKDKWRNLIKFNHVSAEEAKACARSSRSRGVKRAQTFDTATTLLQRLDAGTVQQPNMQTLAAKSISEELMTDNNLGGGVSSSASGPVSGPRYSSARAMSPHRRVKSRQTVADFRHLMLDGGFNAVDLPRDPLALNTARLELTGTVPPPITTGHQDFSFHNFDVAMRSGSETNMQHPPFPPMASTQRMGMQGSNGSAMQGILSDFGLGQGVGGFPTPAQYPPPGDFPLNMDPAAFVANQFRGGQNEYPGSGTWNASFTDQQQSALGKRVSFELPPGSFPGAYGGMAPDQMYPSQQAGFSQNLASSSWNMPGSNSFPNPQDQQLFPPASGGPAEFGTNPPSFENAAGFKSFTPAHQDSKQTASYMQG